MSIPKGLSAANSVPRAVAADAAEKAMREFVTPGDKCITRHHDDSISMYVRTCFGIEGTVSVNFEIDVDFYEKNSDAVFHVIKPQVDVSYPAGIKAVQSAATHVALLQTLTNFGLLLQAVLKDKIVIVMKPHPKA